MILKIWKFINDQQNFSKNLLSYPNGSFLTHEAHKTWIMTINVKKLKKMAKIVKYAKNRDVKNLQDISLNPEIIQ